jgi:hypothetical protein
MSEEIFNISKEGTRKVSIIDGEPVYDDTGEKVPDKKLKGYMSSVFNHNFSAPFQSPIDAKQI